MIFARSILFSRLFWGGGGEGACPMPLRLLRLYEEVLRQGVAYGTYHHYRWVRRTTCCHSYKYNSSTPADTDHRYRTNDCRTLQPDLQTHRNMHRELYLEKKLCKYTTRNCALSNRILIKYLKRIPKICRPLNFATLAVL